MLAHAKKSENYKKDLILSENSAIFSTMIPLKGNKHRDKFLIGETQRVYDDLSYLCY